MSDELLPYYNNELQFIKRMGAQFAEANPKIAGRLRLGPDTPEDPHVARLIEAFAYLNARTRHKLEDDFPEITEAMLGILYPHYLAPIPSMAIVQFELDRKQAELVTGYNIAAGTAVETEPIQGDPCRFRTSYPVTLWPMSVRSCSVKGQPFTAPLTPHTPNAQSVLRLELECYGQKTRFSDLQLDRLRFFLRGQGPYLHDLYEVLLSGVLGVAVASSPGDQEYRLLGPDCIRPVGFERDEGILEYTARSFPGYRLLSEYFAFPDKFLFVDVMLAPGVLKNLGTKLQLYFYLDRQSTELERGVDNETLRLGCTPMVNLYRQRAEPIRLSHGVTEYRVVPDARRPLAGEVYSVDKVVATSPDNQTVEYQPFYSFKHGRDARAQRTFWHAMRRPAEQKRDRVDNGTEVFLSLVDLDFRPSAPADWTVDVQTTCLSRDLPRYLPFGGGEPRLHLAVGAPISRIQCLTRPTPTLRPALRHGTRWRLISHLTLNHLSLIDTPEGADAIREILTLYNFADSAETQTIIDSLLSVTSRRVVGRVGGSVSAGFCRGVEVALHFDEQRLTGGGVFLFASVLERFLGLYSSINSFTKTIATTNRRDGELHRWPPRAGEKVLL